MKIIELNKWIKNQKKANKMKTSIINFKDMDGWEFNESIIDNDKKKFFSIAAFKFTNHIKQTWYQPLIIQREIGILGIIKKL